MSKTVEKIIQKIIDNNWLSTDAKKVAIDGIMRENNKKPFTSAHNLPSYFFHFASTPEGYEFWQMIESSFTAGKDVGLDIPQLVHDIVSKNTGDN